MYTKKNYTISTSIQFLYKRTVEINSNSNVNCTCAIGGRVAMPFKYNVFNCIGICILFPLFFKELLIIKFY